MKRYILTGTPGCGKTSIIRALEIMGYFVVNEAATDVIAYEQMRGMAEPWKHPRFIDDIIRLQKQRQMQVASVCCEPQFYDRSPLCTYALATYLGFKPSKDLLEEIERINAENVYQNRVFLIENLGFCKPTEARKITFEDSLVFEKIHTETYVQFGYECIKIPLAPELQRVAAILEFI